MIKKFLILFFSLFALVSTQHIIHPIVYNIIPSYSCSHYEEKIIDFYQFMKDDYTFTQAADFLYECRNVQSSLFIYESAFHYADIRHNPFLFTLLGVIPAKVNIFKIRSEQLSDLLKIKIDDIPMNEKDYKHFWKEKI